MKHPVLIDIKTCGMTLNQVLDAIASYQAAMPDQEVFMDGDQYAVVHRPRRH